MNVLQTDIIHNTDCLSGFTLLPDNSVDIIVTSPPYNVGVEYSDWDDKLPRQDYYDFTENWLEEAYRVLKDDGRICINVPYTANFGGTVEFMPAEYNEIMSKVGYNFKGMIDLEEKNVNIAARCAWGSWLKPSAPYIQQSKECIIIAYKSKWKHKWDEKCWFDRVPKEEAKSEFMRLVTGNWTYQAETNGLTIANFSESLPRDCFKLFAYENDIVLDPFMGSGTTALVAKLMGLKYIGFEISSDYHQIAEGRLSNYE